MELSFTLFSVSIIWGIAVVTPGPNFFLTAKTAAGNNRRSAFFVALGTSAGTVLWGWSGFFGVTLLFKTAPWIYLSMKLLGGSYLIYLGLKLILSNPGPETNHPKLLPTDRIHPVHNFKLGLLTNLSNPKTAAFVTSLFAATMPANASFWVGAMSVTLMFSISILWYHVVAFVFSLDHFRRLYLKSRLWIDRIAGSIFIGFGLKLADPE